MLPVVNEIIASARQLTRREMVGRLLAGVGAGATWPLAVASHPIHELLRNNGILDEAEKLGAADWKPALLSTQQNEDLMAIAERIVPGSTVAQVDRFIDLLLSVEQAEHKNNFLAGLAAIGAESQRQFGKRFPALSASEQDSLLKDASAQHAKDSAGGVDKENRELQKHFENLKGWISGAYYSSEIGMKELGWTGDRVFASFPGCEHPEGHQ